MLRPKRFKGSERTLLTTAGDLWSDFSTSVKDIVVSAEGDFTEIATCRTITFYDTRKELLNGSRYIFRERRDVDSHERDITLKFRHADRYVAQDRNMSATGSKSAKTKFEEDIKAPFVSLYSFSTRLGVDSDIVFKSLEDVKRLFADLPERIDGFREDESLAAVNDFTARELVLSGARLQVGKSPKVDAECGLIVWYDEGGKSNKPVAVELSYRYGDKNEDYGGGATRRAFEIFEALQSKAMKRWVDPNPRTKTAFVYQ